MIKKKSQVDGTRVSQLALCWRGAIPLAAADIQASFAFTVNRFMALLMSCPCPFEAHDESKMPSLCSRCVAEQLGRSWEHWVIKRVPPTAILSIMSFEFPLWFQAKQAEVILVLHCDSVCIEVQRSLSLLLSLVLTVAGIQCLEYVYHV